MRRVDWRRALAVLLLAAICAATLVCAVRAPAAQATKWHQTGASVFGQPCDPWETIGYRGDLFATHPLTFAELGMGTYLGGLPYRARVRVKDPVSRRSITLLKLDIGAGGDTVHGVRRGLDVLWPALRRLLKGRASCSWTGVLWWRVLK